MPTPSAQLLAPHARALLFDPPADRDEALRRCALAPEDLALARRHRRSHNRLGFAVQLAPGPTHEISQLHLDGLTG